MKHPKYYNTDSATSKRMANIKLKRGDAETILAKRLWQKGYRYRLNYKKLPGSPDIAILRYHIAVFVDGEFWHGKDWQTRKEKLKRNREYWIEKIEENIKRDERIDKELRYLGWTPIHFWAKEAIKMPDECIQAVKDMILDQELSRMDPLEDSLDILLPD